jgi:hypothetical protein
MQTLLDSWTCRIQIHGWSWTLYILNRIIKFSILYQLYIYFSLLIHDNFPHLRRLTIFLTWGGNFTLGAVHKQSILYARNAFPYPSSRNGGCHAKVYYYEYTSILWLRGSHTLWNGTSPFGLIWSFQFTWPSGSSIDWSQKELVFFLWTPPPLKTKKTFQGSTNDRPWNRFNKWQAMKQVQQMTGHETYNFGLSLCHHVSVNELYNRPIMQTRCILEFQIKKIKKKN